MRNLAGALIALVLCGNAYALRPFDSTDAAVNDPGVLELEPGVARLKQGSSRISSLPALAVTYGVGNDTEIGFDAHVNRERDGLSAPDRTVIEDAALNVKHVLRPGSLQDATGPSVAAECSLLLPPTASHDTAGFGCTALVSQQWDALTAHLDFGVERTPQRTTARSLALVAEAPEGWALRPVSELRYETDNAGGWDRTVLAGVIIPSGKDLAFDAAWRTGRSADGPIHELRVGLTWTLDARR